MSNIQTIKEVTNGKKVVKLIKKKGLSCYLIAWYISKYDYDQIEFWNLGQAIRYFKIKKELVLK